MTNTQHVLAHDVQLFAVIVDDPEQRVRRVSDWIVDDDDVDVYTIDGVNYVDGDGALIVRVDIDGH